MSEYRWVQVEPATLTITDIFEGEHVINGGPDGQAWVAVFADQKLAASVVDQLQARGQVVWGVRLTRRRKPNRKLH